MRWPVHCLVFAYIVCVINLHEKHTHHVSNCVCLHSHSLVFIILVTEVYINDNFLPLKYFHTALPTVEIDKVLFDSQQNPQVKLCIKVMFHSELSSELF